MSEFGKIIQKISHNQIHSEKPTDIVYGTVETDMVNGSEVSVRIDQKRVLPEEMLIFSTLYPKPTGEAAGKKLILLRQWGGQRFLVLGGVESDTQ